MLARARGVVPVPSRFLSVTSPSKTTADQNFGVPPRKDGTNEAVEILRRAGRKCALREVEAGTPVGDVCRQLGVSEATFYAWKKKYAHLGVSELRRLRQLEDENARLKRLVDDLTLDKHMLSRRCEKTPEARAPSGARRVVSGDVPGQLRAGLSAGALQSRRLVSTKPHEGSVRAADAHSVIWLMPGPGLGICGSGCSCVGKAGW